MSRRLVLRSRRHRSFRAGYLSLRRFSSVSERGVGSESEAASKNCPYCCGRCHGALSVRHSLSVLVAATPAPVLGWLGHGTVRW
jgi:hypothetical protein